MTDDTNLEMQAGAARQAEVAESVTDMPTEPVQSTNPMSQSIRPSSGNSNNDNNPYARRPAERDLAPHERRITPEQNIPGAPNPQVVQELGDGGTMSGLFDAAGNALTVAAADATFNNNARASKAARQPDNVVHRTINGRNVQWPANTPAV